LRRAGGQFFRQPPHLFEPPQCKVKPRLGKLDVQPLRIESLDAGADAANLLLEHLAVCQQLSSRRRPADFRRRGSEFLLRRSQLIQLVNSLRADERQLFAGKQFPAGRRRFAKPRDRVLDNFYVGDETAELRCCDVGVVLDSLLKLLVGVLRLGESRNELGLNSA